MRTRALLCLAAAAMLAACGDQQTPPTGTSEVTPALGSTSSTIAINVLLKGPATAAQLRELETYGKVRKQLPEIHALFMSVKAGQLDAVKRLPFVAAANPDAVRTARPLDPIAVSDFASGLGTWNLDAVNVANGGLPGRTVTEDGNGVYVGILDTGLLPTWRQYFPEERIAEEYGKAFGGGGAVGNNVSEQPDKWEHDTDSHGTHVTSIVIGFDQGTRQITGVAPRATIIPVKVLNQNGSGWSSVIAEGILYIASLKAGPLAGTPVVINMSLGGSVLDAVEQAAIDLAIAEGVIIVASAGNSGPDGAMGYPGAYPPVISVASAGWTGEWSTPGAWWRTLDLSESAAPEEFYISDFSAQEQTGQDLDVAAPGSWVVGPYQLSQGKTSYFYVGGTSQAAPHVTGIVSLMLQKNGGLTAAATEGLLEGAAIPLPAGCKDVLGPSGAVTEECWDDSRSGSGLITADAALAATP